MATNADVNSQQNGFTGGMNMLLDASRIADNEYVYANNVRNRNDILEPTTNHLLVDAPEGIKQGLYTFNDFMLLFVAGKAYYKDVSVDTWTEIEDFLMDATADFIYACAVPTATMNFQRKAVSNTDAKAGTTVNPTFVFDGNDSGVVCQDGETQPWFIYLSGGVPVARLTKTYAEWENTGMDTDNREYVPIGTLMMFFDSILYIVSQDRKKFYRSLTGRCLDFVINVDTNGDKAGDADTTSYEVSHADITCIQPLNTQGYSSDTPLAFFIGTLDNACYAVVPDRSNLFFDEPTFLRIPLFSATCLNQFSFVDMLGDFGFIDPEGIRSFNAILQQKNEGRNSAISLKVSRAFSDYKKRPLQAPSGSAAVVFDNYAIFSMRTAFGNNLVVYDTLFKVFTSFDWNQYGPVKQFAVTSVDRPRLFGITVNNALVEFYGGTDFATAVVMTREWNSGDASVEIKTENLRAVFNVSTDPGTAKAVVYIDGAIRPTAHGSSFTRLLPDATTGLLYPVTYPALWSKARKRVNLVFPFNGGVGMSAGFLLQWTGGAKLTNMCAGVVPVNINQAQSSKSTQY